MKLTISGQAVSPETILTELHLPGCHVEVIDKGTTSNFFEDYTAYVVTALSLVGNVGLGVLSNHLYRLIYEKRRKVIIANKDLKDLTIRELELFVEQQLRRTKSDGSGHDSDH